MPPTDAQPNGGYRPLTSRELSRAVADIDFPIARKALIEALRNAGAREELVELVIAFEEPTVRSPASLEAKLASEHDPTGR